MPPIISVITVTRNDYDGLLRTVESIRQQSFESIEHVVIDGASTDGTPDWLRGYTAPYDIVSVSEPDKGIFDAMNKGVSLSNGDIIVFMNSADTFADSSTLEFVAEDWRRDKWEWAYGQLEYLGTDLISQGNSRQFKHSQRAIELGIRFAPHQATFMSRGFFDSLGGFDLAFEYASDQELAVRAGMQSVPKVFDRIMARFLLGGTHSQTTYWRREAIYHLIRRKNSALIANRLVFDRIYSFAMAGYRELRKSLATLWGRIVERVDATGKH